MAPQWGEEINPEEQQTDSENEDWGRDHWFWLAGAIARKYDEMGLTRPADEWHTSFEWARIESLPEAPPGPRWTGDMGAIPGEPAYYLDVPKGALESAKAAIVLRDLGTECTYDALLPSGESLGVFPTLGDAASAAESAVGSANGSITQSAITSAGRDSSNLGNSASNLGSDFTFGGGDGNF